MSHIPIGTSSSAYWCFISMQINRHLYLLQIQTDLQYIEEDINYVEKKIIELSRANDRFSLKLGMFADDPNSKFVTQSGPNASKKKWVHAQVRIF